VTSPSSMQTAALFAPTALCPFRLRRGYHLRLGLSFIREPPSIRVIGSLCQYYAT
jgi:hypothetical protein